MSSSNGVEGTGNFRPENDLVITVCGQRPGQGDTVTCKTPAGNSVVTCEAVVSDETLDCTFEWCVDGKSRGDSNRLILCLLTGRYAITVRATDSNGAESVAGALVVVERDSDLWADVARVDVELINADGLPLQRRIKWEQRANGGALKGEFEEQLSAIYIPGANDGDDQGSDKRNYGSGLARFQKHWEDASTQARSTAKWIATIIGAALGALIGTAPLSGLQGKQIPGSAMIAAVLGILFIGVTLFFVLRVLVPNVTVFGDIIDQPKLPPRFSKFHHLQEQAAGAGGVMLPAGINSLAELGWCSQIENDTLDLLAMQMNEARGQPNSKVEALEKALSIRGRWHAYLTNQIAQWTSIGAYIVVKRAAGFARILGLIFGLAGTVLIIWAFLQPQPRVQSSPLSTFHIISTPSSSVSDLAQAMLGVSCKTFQGVVTEANANSNMVTILVKPSGECAGVSISLPMTNLGNGSAPATSSPSSSVSSH
jgi:hypothetical protein